AVPLEAFLVALYPLAVLHGEKRIKVADAVCPMLVEGLRTVRLWWETWEGLPIREPRIEATASRVVLARAPKAVALLSGGVDSLHLLQSNRASYRPGDVAYI